MLITKIKIPKQIGSLLVLAIILNILRVFIFKNYTFTYMFWNIFLAAIPFCISSLLILYTSKDDFLKPFFIVGFILWFLFLPNAPYVITDFIHLGKIHGVPVMYDTFLLFTSAWVCLLMGLYSLWHMERIFLLKFSKKVTNAIIFIVIFFASFGVYLGRFLRFNSWDIFTIHDSLITSIGNIFTKSNNYENVYAYTILFFFFIYISYLSFKNSNVVNTK